MAEKRKLVSGSSALRTNDIWSKTIGLDAHAGTSDSNLSAKDSEQTANLLLLAKMSNTSSESRGGCKRCGGVGHLTFQCRNHIASSGVQSAAKHSSDSSTDTSDDSDSSSSDDDDLTSAKKLSVVTTLQESSSFTGSKHKKEHRKSDEIHKSKHGKEGTKHYRKEKKHTKEKKEKKGKKEKKHKKEKKRKKEKN